jgi:hypothetical protein
MNNELTTYDLGSPAKTQELATVLGDFIKKQYLSVTIQGKEYVQIDGWQWAGAQLGIVPLLTDLQNLSSDKEVKYQATVELRKLSDDKVIGKGIAICSNKEGKKRNFEEYAIASMAQTRAEGKAYRMLLSWLMKAAGYDGTPAEEADGYEKTDMPTEEERGLLKKLVYDSDLTDDERKEAFALIEGCQSFDLYQKIQFRLEARQAEPMNPNQKDISKKVRSIAKAPVDA